jgi:hypothetical protein
MPFSVDDECEQAIDYCVCTSKYPHASASVVVKQLNNCSCVESIDGPQINKTDINAVFRIGQEKIESRRSDLMRSLMAPLKRV